MIVFLFVVALFVLPTFALVALSRWANPTVSSMHRVTARPVARGVAISGAYLDHAPRFQSRG